MEYAHRFSKRSGGMSPSPIRKLVPLMRLPGMISFGGGYPNADTFAFESVTVRFRSGKAFDISRDVIDQACQYGPTDCHPALLPHLQQWHFAKDGVRVNPDQLQVLNGSQEGLHMMAYLFLDPGDAVAVSEPAYPGAIGAFSAFTDGFIPFPIDQNGSVVSELERILDDRRRRNLPMPKFIYEVPNGHNPGGVCLSQERRQHLLTIAERFDVLILEDDPYQLVQLDDKKPLQTLQSLDTNGRVIRLDSFSKIFAPGLRLGYATGPAPVIRMFQLYKQGTNLHVSSMIQAILAGYLEQHGPDAFMDLIRNNCALYRRNRDAMTDAARQYLPATVTYNTPAEGMFIWFVFPDNVDAQAMLDRYGMDQKVLLVPGGAFSTSGGLKNCMRASFSMVTPEQINEGIRRLAFMLGQYTAE